MPLSGQTTVTTAGTAVPLGTHTITGPLMIKALDANTGIVAVGNNGANDVTLSNGMRLEPGDVIIFEYVGSLSSLYLNSGVNGEGVAWLALNA